jgi:hypothetical protein
MKTTIKLWPLHYLYSLREKINPKPIFQRGLAWGDTQRYLLIDSILRRYDIPKLYLNVLDPSRYIHGFEFEVADGQQRIRAIFDFLSDGFPLGPASAGVNGDNLAGLKFSQLSATYKRALQDYEVTVALLEGASKEELQSLFARLQMGVVLNPPELRNALCSVIGSVIEVAALTHPLFESINIPNRRFKRQDYLCHALALATYSNQDDLKAPQLKRFYEDGLTKYDDALINRAYKILDWMNALAPDARRPLRKKWSFVDVFDLLLRHFNWVNSQSESTRLASFCTAYVQFERKRRANTRSPENLLLSPADRQLYNYTVAFKTTPATKRNIEQRRAALDHYFSKLLR